MPDQAEPAMFAKVGTAVFYGVSSVAIMVSNKVVLTQYGFPSANFLALCQVYATIVVIFLAHNLGMVKIPVSSNPFSPTIFNKVWPLPVFYVLNLACGLGATKALSLPMFAVLRRFSIWMTMLGEEHLLGRVAKLEIKLSVASMIFGAVVAAYDDLAFSLYGYVIILLNDFFTAANGVYVKKKLDSKEIGTFGLMFYNCLYCAPFLTAVVYYEGKMPEVTQFFLTATSTFYAFFALSTMLGFILTYAIFLCTQVNSALTTTVIGCLKNVLITYGGMFIGGDYIFSIMNFMGLNISIAGSLVYSYYTFLAKNPNKPPVIKTVDAKYVQIASELEEGAAARPNDSA